jgi:hypothetical protein
MSALLELELLWLAAFIPAFADLVTQRDPGIEFPPKDENSSASH